MKRYFLVFKKFIHIFFGVFWFGLVARLLFCVLYACLCEAIDDINDRTKSKLVALHSPLHHGSQIVEPWKKFDKRTNRKFYLFTDHLRQITPLWSLIFVHSFLSSTFPRLVVVSSPHTKTTSSKRQNHRNVIWDEFWCFLFLKIYSFMGVYKFCFISLI